jgi:hypothetical protein
MGTRWTAGDLRGGKGQLGGKVASETASRGKERATVLTPRGGRWMGLGRSHCEHAGGRRRTQEHLCGQGVLGSILGRWGGGGGHCTCALDG